MKAVQQMHRLSAWHSTCTGRRLSMYLFSELSLNKHANDLGEVVYGYNPSTMAAEARGL